MKTRCSAQIEAERPLRGAVTVEPVQRRARTATRGTEYHSGPHPKR
jgi:hypothetical protein